MPRPSRYNEIGIYHVINRGVERRDIFLDKSDYEQFMAFIGELTTKYAIKIHAFCLMDNHYHILLETLSDNLSEALKYLNVNYSKYFNALYNRTGHLWQGRFKSYPVFDERQFWTVAKYIERNPIAANIVQNIENYPYQSYTLLNKPSHPFHYLIDDSEIHTMGRNEYKEYIDTQLQTESLKSIYKIHRINKEADNKNILKNPISSFFERDEKRDDNIRDCYYYGYTKTDIAEYVGLSKVRIGKIISRH